MVLTLPEAYTASMESTLGQIQDCLPSQMDMISLHNRSKRMLKLLENLMLRHQKLTVELIKFVRTLRFIIKWTAISLVSFLTYYYLRRFHSYIFQSELYQSIVNHRLLLGATISGLALSVYLISQKGDYISALRLIS